jgi:hypothetical protein
VGATGPVIGVCITTNTACWCCSICSIPIVTSLRGVQQASELKNVQRRLGCPRTSLGSLSEAVQVFDAASLQEIVEQLGEQLQSLPRDQRLAQIKQTITLVDGTLITALPKIMEASWRKRSTGKGSVKWRLHTHFELLRGVPTRMDVTPAGGGDYDERAVLETLVEGDRLYVADRGYAKFSLFNKIVAADSSYVVRLRDNSVWNAVEEKYRNDEAQLEQIISDQIVTFPNGPAGRRPDHPIRVICLRINPHTTRGRLRSGCERRRQRRRPPPRHESARRPRGNHCAFILLSLGD